MADPASYRPAPGAIPTAPGVYKFRDAQRRVVYVGKAKSLRSRLTSYFQDLANLHPRTQTMVTTAASVEWTVVSTEVEALQLEYAWIKEFDPRFNIKYRDDKSYPYLALTMAEEYPRATVMRGAKKKGNRYFGPYAHAWAIRETLDLLLRVFPVRTCSSGVFKRAGQVGRPCLLGYIGKCSAPCVGRVSPQEHRDYVDGLASFLAGDTSRHLRRLERDMTAAAEQMEFEQAARLRDDAGALRRAMEKTAIVLPDATDADVVGLAEDPLEVAVQIFHVRGGRVRGQRGWVADRMVDVDTPELVEQFLIQLYGGESGDAIPREILVPALPETTDVLTELLTEQRGGRVALRVPQRGDKRSLQETVEQNAAQTLALHKTRRASDLTTRSRALGEIQTALDLDDAPLRIECIDVSNLQGTEVVASLVVFEDGLPRKGEYRRFVIRGVDGQDDVASVREVVTRRFRRHLAEQAREHDAAVPSPNPEVDEPPASGPTAVDPRTGAVRRFGYAPGLLVVDGGPPQVAAASAALAELGVADVPVVGLAKRLEEVWLPGQDGPVILPRTSEGLYLLQRVRDEAHRFAITHHRQRRSRSMVDSLLDDVPGLGATRRKALLVRFGSLKRLRGADADEIAEVPGIGRRTADAVVAALAVDRATDEARSGVTVDTATGEILDP
jgi:excinuclease ABC subunit C